MIEIVGIWGHALAAAAFAATALWQVRRRIAGQQRLLMTAALGLSALWCIAVAAAGSGSMLALTAEALRNLGWLATMLALSGQQRARRSGLGLLYAVVIGVSVLAALVHPLQLLAGGVEAIGFTALVLRLIAAIGALVLVHNLYTAAAPDARASIRMVVVALAVMWTFDLNLYTIDYLVHAPVIGADALRATVTLLIAGLFALSLRQDGRTRLRVSRTVAFQSLSLVAIGGYLILMAAITSMIDAWGGDGARLMQVGFVVLTTFVMLALVPSERMRAWARVKVAKHLFQHRYDYRQEWMRFTETIGHPGEGADGLDRRIVKAVADITLSPGGLMLAPADAGTMTERVRWTWTGGEPPAPALTADGVQMLASGRIVDLDAVRRGDDDDAGVPDWMIADAAIWAAVPLVHFDRLAAVVLLARPPIDRTLDWEDFDLLRVVGRQAASYLSEAQGQEALSDARRFDEFNRRFAFIMHDIKNLVSQLTLLARNAERHADNPEFRADMVETLRTSAGRMNDLLARLSQHNKAKPEEPRPVALAALVHAVARSKRSLHPLVVDGAADLHALADPARLEQILGHLVQNAIDASRAGEPVTIRLRRAGVDVAVEVIDTGCGMSAEFIRSQLFRPFASTKDGGFGIGAFEARSLAASMGGRIEVDSRDGEGSRFTLLLPQAAADTLIRKAA
ncbi:putative PEP-CTERM system histidine kinase [Sphingomonas jejuensis]|uniref:histidine kinase n=1 Tax=Sphingomonas jejuensis TaxID=904715 RepID=A0ABX0XP33_9SPHN|nr:XrtA/PEP-CTERM system histidine kinase PrsK [Sphingomonas jejuensis]NJC34612.1 putative PEP-CTERM system histidine kinase [Sphingomonas jejuensis]